MSGQTRSVRTQVGGDRRALNVALQAADAMLKHIPTGYGTHIRSLGWPMIMMLHAYEATGDKKYLDGATENCFARSQSAWIR